MRRISCGSSGSAPSDPRHAGHAGFAHGLLGAHLVAHEADALGSRTDEGEARTLDALGKVCVFGKKSVARVNGLGVRDFRGGNDGRDVQVGEVRLGGADADAFVCKTDVLGVRVGSRVHGDGLDAHLAAGALNAQGDFAAVGDQNFSKHNDACGLFDDEERLAEFHGLAVFDADFLDRAVHVGLDFIEKLHGFDDADDLPLLDGVAHLDEGIGARRRRAVERADHRTGERRAGLLRGCRELRREPERLPGPERERASAGRR